MIRNTTEMNIQKLQCETVMHLYGYIDEIHTTYDILCEKKCGAIFLTLTRQLYEIAMRAEILQEKLENIVSYLAKEYNDNIKAYKKCIIDQEDINQTDSGAIIQHYQDRIRQCQSKLSTLEADNPTQFKTTWHKLKGSWAKENASGENKFIFISRETTNYLSEASHCTSNFLKNRYKTIELEFSETPLDSKTLWENEKESQDYFLYWLNRARDACVPLITERNNEG